MSPIPGDVGADIWYVDTIKVEKLQIIRSFCGTTLNYNSNDDKLDSKYANYRYDIDNSDKNQGLVVQSVTKTYCAIHCRVLSSG